MGEHHALGLGRCSGGVHDLEQRLRGWVGARIEHGLPVGREHPVVLGRVGREVVEGQLIEVGQARGLRVGGIGSGAERQEPGARAARDPLQHGRRHPQVEGHQDRARDHRAPEHRGQRRGGRAPGQQSVAGLEPSGSQTPRGQSGAAAELGCRPGVRHALVGTQAEGRPVGGIACGRVVEQVHERRERGHVRVGGHGARVYAEPARRCGTRARSSRSEQVWRAPSDRPSTAPRYTRGPSVDQAPPVPGSA